MLAVVVLGLKLARLSSRSSSHYDSSYSSSYSTSEREELLKSLSTSASKTFQDQMEEVAKGEQTTCATRPTSTLSLSLSTPEGRVAYAAALSWPKNLPAPIERRGLEFFVLPDGDPEAPKTCSDATVAMIDRVAEGLRLASVSPRRREGAVVIETTTVDAASYLLASDLTQVMKTSGDVVAFVASSTVVTLAPARDLKAVQAAARISAESIDTSGGLNCGSVEPLVLHEGRWAPWVAPLSLGKALEAHRRAAIACDAAMLQVVLEQVDGVASMLEGKAPRLAATRGFERSVGSQVEVLAPQAEVQLFAKADRVLIVDELGVKTTLSWDEFARTAEGALKPVTVRGHLYKDVYEFDPRLAPAFAPTKTKSGPSHHRE